MKGMEVSKETTKGDFSKGAGQNIQNILTEQYTVRANEIDSRGRLSYVSLFNYLFDAAGKHAHELGVALHELLAGNYAWVLSRMAVRVNFYPGWRDTITVETWPSGVQRVFAFRNFRVSDQHGRTVGTAVSSWLVISTETRRPIRMKQFLEKMNRVFPDEVPEGAPEKLPRAGETECEKRFHVRYRDIDLNNHVTSVSYMEWVIESLPADVLRDGMLEELEINYLAETFFGDRVISGCSAQDGERTVFIHRIDREGDGQELVRAKTVWKR